MIAPEQTHHQEEMQQLLQRAKARLPQLKLLLEDASSHWGYEDHIYRLYHQSLKVYGIQGQTERIVAALQDLASHLPLNGDFVKIITAGTGKHFDDSHNKNWLRHTRPMLEAFFHAKHFLEMVCKYAEALTEAPQALPSGWATVLYLYNLR